MSFYFAVVANNSIKTGIFYLQTVEPNKGSGAAILYKKVDAWIILQRTTTRDHGNLPEAHVRSAS